MPAYRNPSEARCGAALGSAYVYEPFKLSYTLSCTYLPDFVNEATKTIVECKGLFDAADRRKMLAVKAQHPGYSICIWFTNPNKTISKTSKTRYRDWCEAAGIEWAAVPPVQRKPVRRSR